MPYSIQKLRSGKIKVSGPSGVHSKGTSMKKAKAQLRLLHAIEHSDWRPTGKPAKK
jgi:hypothetical protein